ncbi:MAG: septal ring lytic transglycosylase RlpA family protein [Pseudomonadota bacterium]
MITAFKRVSGQPVMIRNTSMALMAVGILALSASASEAGRKTWRDANASANSGHSFSGTASFYGNESGSKTASGQRFNQEAMTAAHRSLPFGTRLKVTHGGRSVVVTVNDRGPFIKGRVLDLSKGAARAVGLTSRGVGHVVAEVQ